MKPLSEIELDRARGAIIASAAGDALGSQYEFGPALPADVEVTFGTGHFGHAPYEWTDDTSMAIPILQAIADHKSLLSSKVLGGIASVWQAWALESPDVGVQTQSVLRSISEAPGESHCRKASRTYHEERGRSAGNGSLMRTGPVALGFLRKREQGALVEAAGRIAQLTHWEDDNIDACVLWSLAIKRAIRDGELDMESELPWIPSSRRDRWKGIVAEALEPGVNPADFAENNGWVVGAFQQALAAVYTTDSLVSALETAIRGGNDTDSTAAIAGSLAGAYYGMDKLPKEWLGKLHGWPGSNVPDLVGLVDLAVVAPRAR